MAPEPRLRRPDSPCGGCPPLGCWRGSRARAAGSRAGRRCPRSSLGLDASSQFLTSGNFFYLCISIGEVAIMTLPLTLIVITGEIDLSVASTLGLASALVGDLWSHGWPMPADHPDRARRRRRDGRVQRLPGHARRPALARGHDRHADALPRHRRSILLGPNTIANFPLRYTKIGDRPGRAHRSSPTRWSSSSCWR